MEMFQIAIGTVPLEMFQMRPLEMFHKLLILIFFVFLQCSVQAQEAVELTCRRLLTDRQIERIRESKELIADVDHASLQETIEKINRTDCPSIQSLMSVAMARTYAELIREYDLKDRDARERLYHKIQMNMAYLQFTAGRTGGKGSSLNRLIQQKLIRYLPDEILEHPGFYVTLDN